MIRNSLVVAFGRMWSNSDSHSDDVSIMGLGVRERLPGDGTLEVSEGRRRAEGELLLSVPNLLFADITIISSKAV